MQDDVIEDIANIVLRVASSENTSVILLKQQLSETERAIANLMNAIEQGIITTTTTQRISVLLRLVKIVSIIKHPQSIAHF